MSKETRLIHNKAVPIPRQMNISETNLTNITKYGYDLNKSIADELFQYSEVLVIFLLIGVSFNCLELYGTFKSLKGDRFGITFLALIDLTVCVFGSSCGILLNTYPFNFFGDSLCAVMLGSNMLLANVSLVCILNVTTFRYIIFRYPSFSMKNKDRKRLTVIGMLFAIILSFPSFIFYGETDIVIIVQNATFSGKVCGAARISDNETLVMSDNGTLGTSDYGTLFQVYPIVMSIIYTSFILYLIFIQMHLTVLFFRGMKIELQKNIFFLFESNAASNFKKRVNILDSYEDKDYSVLDPDALICRSCDELENNGKLNMKSGYELMLDIDIPISENTNLIDATSTSIKSLKNLQIGGIPTSRLIFWYTVQPLVVISCALNVIGRAYTMFSKSNVLSEISEMELSWYFINLSVISSATNPLYYSLFSPISSSWERCVNFFLLQVKNHQKKEK